MRRSYDGHAADAIHSGTQHWQDSLLAHNNRRKWGGLERTVHDHGKSRLAVKDEERWRIRDHEKNVYACMVLGGLTTAVKRNDADRVLLNHNVMCILL